MRAFIGIDFDEHTKNKIRNFQQEYWDIALKGRWKHRDNFHITLKFLSEVDTGQEKMIQEAMTEICGKYSPFELKLTEWGIFKGRDSIRALWLGVDGNLTRLHTLQSEIDLALEPIGFQRESRKYNPHITIGQDIIFDNGFEQAKRSIKTTNFEPMLITNLYLFKSEQIQNRRIYSKVSEYELR